MALKKKCFQVAASARAKAHVRCITVKAPSGKTDKGAKKGASGGSSSGKDTRSVQASKSGNIHGDYSKARISKGEVFGKITDEEAIQYAKIAGVPGDMNGRIFVSKTKFGEIKVSVDDHEDFYMDRLIDPKRKTIQNVEFSLTKSGKTKYKGSEIFERQVDEAIKGGYTKIETIAAIGENYNGYYTWMRLGYEPKKKFDYELGKFNKRYKKNYKKITDLMQDPDGREFWRNNGDGYPATFTLDKNSYSYKTMKAYMSEKKG